MGSSSSKAFGPPVVMGTEALMAPKGHGTCSRGVQEKLKWGVSATTADKICCHNRHYAEHSGYAFGSPVSWLADVAAVAEYYDSVHGKRVFFGPKGRSVEAFVAESRAHGWPSFRDNEVDWANVRVLPGGEAVTADGVHLGHNIPDGAGNRYCINLVCIAAEAAP